jgi:hypothetical protein
MCKGKQGFMMNNCRSQRFSIQLTDLLFLIGFLVNCSGNGVSSELVDSSVAEASYAYEKWPNDSTTDTASNNIVSKVLISDLDQDGILENIFLSELLGSTNPQNSILRITQGHGLKEVINFKSAQVHLLKDSIPFAIDLDNDGLREILFVSYSRDSLISFEFKNGDLKNIFIRWIVDLPQVMSQDFDRGIKLISYQGKEWVKVGPYGIRELNGRKTEVITLE